MDCAADATGKQRSRAVCVCVCGDTHTSAIQVSSFFCSLQACLSFEINHNMKVPTHTPTVAEEDFHLAFGLSTLKRLAGRGIRGHLFK